MRLTRLSRLGTLLPALILGAAALALLALPVQAGDTGAAAAGAADLTAVERVLDRADRDLAEGRADAALAGYDRAATLVRAGAHEDAPYILAYIRAQQGNASWLRFARSGNIDDAWMALYNWEEERAMYEAGAFPEAYMVLVNLDIGRAHMALAMNEGVQDHMWHAVNAYRTALDAMPKENMEAIQFILRTGYGTPVANLEQLLSLAR